MKRTHARDAGTEARLSTQNHTQNYTQTRNKHAEEGTPDQKITKGMLVNQAVEEYLRSIDA